MNSRFEQVQTLLGFSFGEGQGWDDTNSVATSGDNQKTSLASHLDNWGWVLGELYSKHHAVASHFLDNLRICVVDILQTLLEDTASALDLLEKFRLAQTVENIECNGSGQGVSAKSGAMITYARTTNEMNTRVIVIQSGHVLV